MKEDHLSISVSQPALFDFSDISTGSLELFPAVWGALEGLVSRDSAVRGSSLDRLQELGAPRFSPLVIYVLASRIIDPDIVLRVRVIKVLGEVLTPDQNGHYAPEAVVQQLSNFLYQMRVRQIFALLEASDADREIEIYVARLLNACPFAGGHLADIISSRSAPIPVRIQAANFLGLVGFLDAIPSLERLEARLISRLEGQAYMPFAPPTALGEADLLPAVQKTLRVLKSL